MATSQTPWIRSDTPTFANISKYHKSNTIIYITHSSHIPVQYTDYLTQPTHTTYNNHPTHSITCTLCLVQAHDTCDMSYLSLFSSSETIQFCFYYCVPWLFQASANPSFWIKPLNSVHGGWPKSLTLVYVRLYLFCHSPPSSPDFPVRIYPFSSILLVPQYYIFTIAYTLTYLIKTHISSTTPFALVSGPGQDPSLTDFSPTIHIITHPHTSHIITCNSYPLFINTKLYSTPTLIKHLSSTIQHPLFMYINPIHFQTTRCLDSVGIFLQVDLIQKIIFSLNSGPLPMLSFFSEPIALRLALLKSLSFLILKRKVRQTARKTTIREEKDMRERTYH
ncbi:hypothetical protein VP01_768g2 [Puccinia sorghi]|uniref:Uncharacterized protein n=1 Tax=Puccinia sorghi TaxID=27349 RepID=A0A0L6UBM0_9BASI|nr:hypothetical protein VP01_768g2 [Puccinia sorghi]